MVLLLIQLQSVVEKKMEIAEMLMTGSLAFCTFFVILIGIVELYWKWDEEKMYYVYIGIGLEVLIKAEEGWKKKNQHYYEQWCRARDTQRRGAMNHFSRQLKRAQAQLRLIHEQQDRFILAL